MLPKCYGRPLVRVDSTFDTDPESKEVTEKVNELSFSESNRLLSHRGGAAGFFFFYLVEKEGLGGTNSSLFGK